MSGYPRVVSDPAELVALSGRHRECHLYGLADLTEPFWSPSTWWRRGDAAVGVVPLPASDEVALYAVSPAAPTETLDIVAAVHDGIPSGAVGSAPLGLVARLRGRRALDDLGPRRKMLVTQGSLRRRDLPAGTSLRRLGPGDHDGLAALHARDPGAVFFVRSMLDEGHFQGALDGGGLVAVAGTHVLDRTHRVAAIGAVMTDPAHRGRGLAGALVGELAARLIADGLTVGLNVGDDNPVAGRVYERLGFRTVHRYVEARLR